MMDINKNNIKSYLLDFVDHELNQEEQDAVLKYIRKHPEWKVALQWLQKTKLENKEEVSFPDKSLLYRKESNPVRKNFFLFALLKPGIAASVAVCLILAFLFLFHKNDLGPTTGKIATLQKEAPGPDKEIQKDTPLQKATSPASKISGSRTSEKLTLNRPKQHARPAQPSDKKGAPSLISKSAGKPLLPNLPHLTITPLPHEDPGKTLAEIKTAQVPVPPAHLSTTEWPHSALSPSGKDVVGALQRISEHKERLDSSLTDKVLAFQDKLAHPLKALNIKEVKIGGLSIVFN